MNPNKVQVVQLIGRDAKEFAAFAREAVANIKASIGG